MNPPTLQFARAARDGGIHALAALDYALAEAINGLPLDHGLSDEQIRALKQAFGKAMGEIVDKIINPAVRAFPELEPSQAVWSAAVVEQSKQLGLRAAINMHNASTEPLVKRSRT